MSGVKVRNLSYTYNGKPVLNDISFELERGEVLAILGPNGSGKTTLLKCLNGILKPHGSVLISGRSITEMKMRDVAKILGYVPQMHQPAFPYRVIDVVISGRAPHLGFAPPSRKDYELAEEALRKLGLSNVALKPYTQLSGGELRLVLIARALVQQPKILLLDEPLSHLDLKNKVVVLKTIKSLADEGMTIIFTEHDPNFAFVVAEKALLMSNGRIVKFGKTSEVLTEELISKVYGVEVEVLKGCGVGYIFPKITTTSRNLQNSGRF